MNYTEYWSGQLHTPKLSLERGGVCSATPQLSQDKVGAVGGLYSSDIVTIFAPFLITQLPSLHWVLVPVLMTRQMGDGWGGCQNLTSLTKDSAFSKEQPHLDVNHNDSLSNVTMSSNGWTVPIGKTHMLEHSLCRHLTGKLPRYPRLALLL